MSPIGRREYLKTTGAVAGLPVLGRAGRAERNGAVDQREGGEIPPPPIDLRTEYEASPNNLPPLTDPATVDGADPETATYEGSQEPFVPRFSWRVPAPERGAGQRAYRLLVASTPEMLEVGVADVYDSGKVESARSTAVSFAREESLAPNATYYWTVRVWNGADEPSPWSEPASFTMAIPDTPDHWEGTWIGYGIPTGPTNAPSEAGPVKNEDSPLLRTEFELEADVESARAHVLTLGYGELYVNGERIGEAVLDPAWTAYDRNALYSTYDVEGALDAGTNALGIWLGRGWFSKTAKVGVPTTVAHPELDVKTEVPPGQEPVAPLSSWESFGPPRALLQLDVEYADGTTDVVTSDTSWMATRSPITENDVWDGEEYNALLEQPGWATPDFDATSWGPAVELSPPHESDTPVEVAGGNVGVDDLSEETVLRPQRVQPIEVTETIDPVSIDERSDGYVVDFGQNFAGWIELAIDGALPGDRIVLKYAELLGEDGDVDRRSTQNAEASDTYVAKGANEEVYEPRFTYHGFRYVKVEGYPGDLAAEDVTGKVVHTAYEQTGSFACSNEDLNQVQHCSLWSLRSNTHSIPTDCPQRSERLGWTGDVHMAANAELFNFDAARFYEKRLRDYAVNQSGSGNQSDTIPHAYGGRPADPNWGKVRVTIPWFLYRYTGDEQLLADHYEGMKAYADYWHGVADDGVVPAQYNHYGDWVAPEGANDDLALLNTFAHYQSTETVAKAATALGREIDATKYGDRATAIAEAFNDEFFDPGTSSYGSGDQTTYALPLFLGIVPAEHEEAVLESFVTKVREEDGGKLRTGFVGTRPLVFALVEYGHEELAYHVVSQPEHPGWVYMVRQGATTLWEAWGSDAAPVTSRNHRPWPLVSEWFYKVLSGINAAEPGFEHVSIAPRVLGDLEWAEGSVETVRGEVSSRWERTGNELTLDAALPWNTTGTVRVPTLDHDRVRVEEDGRTIWVDGRSAGDLPDGVKRVYEDDEIVVEVGAGSYSFRLAPAGEDADEPGDDPPSGDPEADRPGLDWTDYTLETEFSIEQSAAGVVFRAQDLNNLYMWQILLDVNAAGAADPHVLRTHTRENGAWTTLKAVPFAFVGERERHRLTVDLGGSEITTYVNGRLVDTTVDTTYASGTVGFREHTGERALFDTVRVTGPGGEILFADDFAHDCVNHFSGGTITDEQLDLDGTGVVLRQNREC